MIRIKSIAINSTNKFKGDGSSFITLEHIESFTGKFVGDLHPSGTQIEEMIAHRPGDILFGKLRPYLSKSFLAMEHGGNSGEFLVIRPKRSHIEPKFLFYVTLCKSFIEFISACAYGVKMPRTNWEQIGNFKITLPPMSVQRQIIIYLDAETSRIDQLIAELENQKSLLRERRQVVITEAVSGKVDQFAFDVSTWKETKLKREANIVSGSDSKCDDGPYQFYGANGVIGQTDHATVCQPTVLIGRVGSAGSISYVDEICGVSDNALIYRNKIYNCPRFDYYLLCSLDFKAEISKNAQPLITASNIADRKVIVPTQLSERIAISRFLDKETYRIDQLISEIDNQISLLKEWRQALITSAITGQIDVSQMVA